MSSIVKYFTRIGISISILVNVILGGYSNQTFSARNYERKRQGKLNIVWFIDMVFFRDKHHCSRSWCYWIVRKELDQ